MGPVSAVVTFLLIWWTMLFAVLPFGHKRDIDGTPVMHGMKKKLLINTGISIALWIGLFALVEADIISFRLMALDMAQERGAS